MWRLRLQDSRLRYLGVMNETLLPLLCAHNTGRSLAHFGFASVPQALRRLHPKRNRIPTLVSCSRWRRVRARACWSHSLAGGARIPVTYIAGTSMGGLVDGAYATGKNAAEVREVVDHIDWNQVIGGQVPFGDLSFRRKQVHATIPARWNLAFAKACNSP